METGGGEAFAEQVQVPVCVCLVCCTANAEALSLNTTPNSYTITFKQNNKKFLCISPLRLTDMPYNVVAKGGVIL